MSNKASQVITITYTVRFHTKSMTKLLAKIDGFSMFGVHRFIDSASSHKRCVLLMNKKFLAFFRKYFNYRKKTRLLFIPVHSAR